MLLTKYQKPIQFLFNYGIYHIIQDGLIDNIWGNHMFYLICRYGRAQIVAEDTVPLREIWRYVYGKH